MKPGQVVLVKFPFSSLESAKKRPALVLSHVRHTDKIRLVTVAMITSQIDGIKLKGDVLLEHWAEAKLLHQSLVRLSKVASLDMEIVDKQLGHLSKVDTVTIQKVFKELYEYWLE